MVTVFSLKDTMSDFWPIWLQNFDLKFTRYFGGQESYKLSFEPLLEKLPIISSSEIKCSTLVFLGILTINHMTNSYVFFKKRSKFVFMVPDH